MNPLKPVLAVAYACQGEHVALLDNDPQASSSYWASLRDPELPAVSLVAKHERPKMYETQSFHHRLPNHTDLVIVDGHSNARGRDLESLLRATDVILVPMLPSSIDIRAGGCRWCRQFVYGTWCPEYRRRPGLQFFGVVKLDCCLLSQTPA